MLPLPSLGIMFLVAAHSASHDLILSDARATKATAQPLAATGLRDSSPQPAAGIRTDDAAAQGFVNGTVAKQKRSRTFDRRFWWSKDREAALQLRAVWDAGVCNSADYPTTHHSAQHHKLVRQFPPKCFCEVLLESKSSQNTYPRTT